MTDQNNFDQTRHTPRPITPDDESYGDLMLRFTAHPVKPKYWFEEFGDHWSCSCGQINKGDRCTNCGLERDLLRRLFIVHKPSSDPRDPSEEGSGGEAFPVTDPGGASSADPGSGSHGSDGRKPASRLIGWIITLLVLLLLGSGAFLYFVVLPEMEEQDQARSQSIRDTLTETLPDALGKLPSIQYDAYCASGDALCDNGDYHDSISYYRKAALIRDDESIQQKILDAKFGYVKAHSKKGNGQHFVEYLTELHAVGYDGIEKIYSSYYAWNVKIIANNLPDDFDTDMETLNKSDTIYFHVTLTGGPPDASIRFYYKVIWPDGKTETEEIDSTWTAGSQFSSRFQYALPLFAKEGKLTFKLYSSDSRDLMNSDSVQLKK